MSIAGYDSVVLTDTLVHYRKMNDYSTPVVDYGSAPLNMMARKDNFGISGVNI